MTGSSFARCCAAVLVASFFAVVPGSAFGAQAALALHADAERTGSIGLAISGPAAALVTIQETVGDQTQPVATAMLDALGGAMLPTAAVWRCDRRERSFTATAVAADGTPMSASATLTTPSCRDRIALGTRPRRPRAERPMIVRIRDRWRVGDIAMRLCLRAPASPRARCRRVGLEPGERRVSHRFRVTRSGLWRVRVSGPGLPGKRRKLLVRRSAGGLRVLATGDSMIQIIDSFLDLRIGSKPGVSVRTDARISTGISKPAMLDWVEHARRQAHALRPDVVVMFIGANDGFPIAGAQCCGGDWITRYVQRARAMMRSYARGGRATVYWLLLPSPRDATFRRVFRGVNTALRRAAKRFQGEVRLIDLRRVFTPGGQFRAAMRWHGRTVTVRQADGVHLSTTGASIATSLILRAMRRDGAIR